MNKRINDIEWLKSQYTSGRSMQSIADELDVCRNTVRNRLVRNNISRRKSWEHIVGSTFSENHRRNLSNSHKRYWAEHPMTDKLRLKISKGRTQTGISEKGRRIFIPDRGRVLEHRFVMEQIIDRPLESAEQVHHIDGNRLNNNPINLILFSNSNHQKHHNETRSRNKKGQFTRQSL